MGCDCQNGTSTTAVDPCRRVNYSLGMILGVDDFVQESTYHSSHREALARLALGWGTLSGLEASIDLPEKTDDPRSQVRIGPGAALLPNGKLVHVDSDQCCNVPNWVGELDAATFQPSGAPPEKTGNWAQAWVTLSFCESKCADVPVPGDPCRTDDKLTAPSRVQDGFRLDLSWSRPDQTEEDAIRDFFQWALSIGVDQKATGSEEELLKAVRAAAKEWIGRPAGSTIIPSDFLAGTPPASLFYKEELLRSVLRLWTTELRPLWSVSCSDASRPAANAIALAGLWIPLKKIESKKDGSEKIELKWVFDDTRSVELDLSQRPNLLSLRAVQEMVKDLKETVASSTVVPATTIAAGTNFGLASSVGSSAQYARADHSHGTPPLPASVGRQKTPYELVAAGELVLNLDGDNLVEPEIVSSYHSSAKVVFANLQTLRILLAYDRREIPKLSRNRIIQLLPVIVEESTSRILLAIERNLKHSEEFGSDVDVIRIDSLDKAFSAKRISFQYQVFEFASPRPIKEPIVIERVRK